MGSMKKLILLSKYILSIGVGILFLYSAFTKIHNVYSFERFQYSFVEILPFSWNMASILALLVIGIEITIGIFLILNIYGKNKLVLRSGIVMILIFSIYLAYLWIKEGNNVNCGCFGDEIWMSPSSSLIKNALLLISLGILSVFHKGWHTSITYKIFSLCTPIIIILTFVSFLVSGLAYPNKQKVNKPIDYSSITNVTTILNELHTGKHIIAFVSATCPHCRIAAYKMHLMKKSDPTLPFYFVITGYGDLSPFWLDTKAWDIPFIRIEPKAFLKITGGKFPVIDWVKDDTIQFTTDYVALNQNEIEKWLKEKDN